MQNQKIELYIKAVINNMPSDWLNLTTHRLDIYNEALAKTEFISQFEVLFNSINSEASALQKLPTAYDYIRLGHPLSCVLEWSIARLNTVDYKNVISFSSQTMPILAVLRQNTLEHKNTRILYTKMLPSALDLDVLKTVYGYNFEIEKIDNTSSISKFDGSSILIQQQNSIETIERNRNIDFYVTTYPQLGSVILINGEDNSRYSSVIQHVRRRESIAMTPKNTLVALKAFGTNTNFEHSKNSVTTNKQKVLKTISKNTNTTAKALVASSGLSMQYAIMMGLVHNAQENHSGKAITFLVPPNCYGGTNDQARRVAKSIANVEILDLPVDGDNDMVKSMDTVLAKVAHDDAVPFIIAEIPTNPRVEVPNLDALKAVLTKTRQTATGDTAIAPIFILDQTFCPNVNFLGEGEILSDVSTIAYVSGSKFPSGGKCTAGYGVANKKAEHLITKIEQHLQLCDNEATAHQYKILSEQLPSMNQRIFDAYKNTREFVNFIQETLPEAKINFVSEDLADRGFTPSVFSLDLPTKGGTDKDKEAYKRALNLKLINLMIKKIPHESKFCVSYGQLKGCYWTIPATSTQGTTKEVDKDYIVRASLSPDLDLEAHKLVFREFVGEI